MQSCADLNDGRNGITFVPSQGNCFCWTGVGQTVSSTVADFAYFNTCTAVQVPATTTAAAATTTTTTASNAGTTAAAGNNAQDWTCDWQGGTDGVAVNGVTSDQFTGTGLTKSACVQV